MLWLAQMNWRLDLVLPWMILAVGLVTFLAVLVARLLRTDRTSPTPGINQSESRWMLAIIFAFPAAAGAMLLVWIMMFMWQASERRSPPTPRETTNASMISPEFSPDVRGTGRVVEPSERSIDR